LFVVINLLRSRRAASLRALKAVKPYAQSGEIADLVAHLASREAGSVTGASLPIDGGFAA
jgi:3-oxoacyl-[acyl-carrier protein] reductase